MATAVRSSPQVVAMLDLPSELLLHILSFLSPLSLASVAATCRHLHRLTQDDLLWTPHILQNLPGHTAASLPSVSARALYIQHHPFWFVPRGKLWFGSSNNNPYHGKLLISRYSPSRNAIEAFALVAERGLQTAEHWDHDQDVLVFPFAPRVQLHLDQPVLRLDSSATFMNSSGIDPSEDIRNGAFSPTPDPHPQSLRKWQKEVNMPIHLAPANSGTFSHFIFSRPLPQAYAEHVSTKVWPPRTIPARERVRAQSSNHYRASGHKPQRLDEISQTTFRIRKWLEYTSSRTHHLSITRELPPSTHTPLPLPGWLPLGAALPAGMNTSATGSINSDGNVNMRVGEDVTTYATLDPALYTPTPKKPWRGIWVGDYNGHGCEFLVMLQPDHPIELPPTASWVLEQLRTKQRQQAVAASMGLPPPVTAMAPTDADVDTWSYDTGEGITLLEALGLEAPMSNGTLLPFTPVPPMNTPYEDAALTDEEGEEDEDEDGQSVYKGGIYAVKLTGDPNIPKGEYTFIAPDIGRKGLLRVAREQIFEGARVVRSVGHSADRGFREDTYTPSQLILISKNKLAQYWERSQHISFFERVDIDRLTKCD